MEEFVVILVIIGFMAAAIYFATVYLHITKVVLLVAAVLFGAYVLVRFALWIYKRVQGQQNFQKKRKAEIKRLQDEAVRSVLALAMNYQGTLTAAQLHANSRYGIDESRQWLEHCRLIGEAYSEEGKQGVKLYFFPGLFPQRNQANIKDDQARQRIYKLVHALKPKVHPAVYAKAMEISKHMYDFLPRVEHVAVSDYERFTIKQVGLDYFPNLLETYLNLSPELAQNTPIYQDQTAHDILASKLDLLAQGVTVMLQNIHQDDVQALLKTARFLETRLEQVSLNTLRNPEITL